MSRFWKAGLRLVLETCEALALLPFFAKVLLVVALAAWVVVVVDWNQIFPPAPKTAAVAPGPARAEADAPSPDQKEQVPAAEQKVQDRVTGALPSQEPTGKFTVSDPLVGPDGSIREGEAGSPFFLGEIKSFSSKDVCTRASGERWACGLHAYATLRNSIAHKVIQCENAGSPEQPRVSCRLDGQNLALILVKSGLVELKDDVQDDVLRRAQTKAKSARSGIWDR